MNRCLLIACSKAKVLDSALLPALDRYDGPYFRVIRRFLREAPQGRADLKVLILSAEFGLIPDDRLIPNYDRWMTKARAEELRPLVLHSLRNQFAGKKCSELFVVLGADYLSAISGFAAVLPSGTKIILAKGAQGVKARQLKYWLGGIPSDVAPAKFKTIRPLSTPRGRATIHGCSIVLTPTQILDRAREALRDGYGQPDSFRDWYVLVDGKRVGPKWLVSQITDLAVDQFTSSEARRVLTKLGIKVYRV
jgi:hypothetical protein